MEEKTSELCLRDGTDRSNISFIFVTTPPFGVLSWKLFLSQVGWLLWSGFLFLLREDMPSSVVLLAFSDRPSQQPTATILTNV